MDNPGKYCCFICPEKDHKEKLLTALCPTCKNAYGFPLDFPPEAIGRYRIVKSLGRGFYAATFLCEYGNLDTQCVLKVSSKKVYQFFGRNFEDECRKHKEAAQDAEHIVPIVESFEEEVAFGSISLTCYIAVIDYIDGPTLDKFLEIPESASARSLAQIAIDLVSILGEFAIIHKFHNDLHSKNIIIQTLRDGTRRAVAIDLGSVGDYSRSDSCKPRFGDQHWLCRHLQRMINKLRETGNDIDRVDDLDNRIAEALERTLFFYCQGQVL